MVNNIAKTFRPAYKWEGRSSRLLLMFCLLFAISTTLPSIASAANSLSQFGITWTFDKELSTNGAGGTYQYGQFANGDYYWVVGPVTIIRIDPHSTKDADGRTMHGSMVNPSPKDGQTQGYDNSALKYGYDPNYNVALDVSSSNPLVLQPHSSLVSSISRLEPGARPQLRVAAVLTVLDSPAPVGSFRPPYSGADKTPKFNENQLDYSKLSNLVAPASIPRLEQQSGDAQSASVERMFERVWLDHRPGFESRYLHPSENMPDYGREIALQIGEGALMLNLDFTNEEKETLLIRFVQLGIDLYGIVQDEGEENWVSNGGHQHGRKLPILFAGLVLNDANMKAIGDKSGDYLYDVEYGAGNPPPDYIHFQEDNQTFYVKDEDIFSSPYELQYQAGKYIDHGTVNVENGSTTVTGVDTTWLDATAAGHYFVVVVGKAVVEGVGAYQYQVVSVDEGAQTLELDEAFDGYTESGAEYIIANKPWIGHGWPGNHADYEEYTDEHKGMPEWGIRHATIPTSAGPDWGAYYRQGCAWGSHVLTLHIMDAKSLWNHDVFFDYIDRYVQIQKDAGAEEWLRYEFTRDMWDTYRADYGPVWPSDPNNPTPELQVIGDKFVDENVALIFDVNATDPNNEPITYSAQGLPSGATLDPLTGEFAWTPSYTQAGSYQVRFRASDGNSQDSETITITVNNVNRPPVIGAITDQSVNENALLSLSVNATDPDGQALTYSVSSLPAGAVFVSQTLTWTPSYDQAGTFPVTFTADDGQAQDTEAITITVINVNRTPVLTAINNQSVWADDPLTFTIDATDPDGDAVTYSVGTLPSGATFTGQDFDWTPSQGQMGSYDVTFIASDGQLQDSEIVTITVDVDSLAPTVTNLSPAVGAIQVPLNNLITLDVTDTGKGIEPESVKIKVKTNSNPNNNTVYFGDMDHYISLLGDCRRIGSNADYKFVFQPTQDLFYYDQTVTITVNATDLAGNVMDEYSYSFATEMHSFGQNKQVNSGLDNNDRPVTVCDSSGNIWTAWHTGSIGNRDIYIGKLAAGEENFGGTVQLTDNTNDQCNPAVALDSSDKLYVVWQDNREGDWDIYVSTSVDGTSWSTETRVNDPNEDNQVNPAIVIDGQSPNQAHVVWQDDRAGNQDICIATSSDGFATKTVSQITTDSFDQVEPAVTADSDDTIYVVWTDGRNGSNDIYGAASNNPWTNVAIVSNANNQSSPTIAAESVGAILHLLWVDDTLGDKDIYYASSDGLPGSPLTGSSIIDDSSGADQLEPAIAVTGSTGNDLKVFACWQDWRNTDTDLYFAELSSSSGTNVFVGDGGSSTYQGEPVIGIDEYSHPYLIWADNRSTNTEIYYAGSTFVEPVALALELVIASASSSTTVGADPQAITTVDDVSVVVPAGACSYDVAITVTKIANPQAFAAPCLGGYDFGPSGIQFSQPVTITIPYVFAGSDISATPYWFNALSGNLSQQGITGVQDIVISPTLHALSFKTTHFTAFYLLGGGAAAVLGGGGGGGCSVSAGGEGNMVEFVLPYIGLVVVMAILKVRDARERKARST